MAAERTGGLRRFIPFNRERVSPEVRDAQTVRHIRRAAEEGLRFRYSVAQELVVSSAHLGSTGEVDVLVFTHQTRDGGWGSVAVLHEPGRKSTDHPTILGSVALDALSLEDAVGVTDEWISNSTSVDPRDLRKSAGREFPLLKGRYEENIRHVTPNIASPR